MRTLCIEEFNQIYSLDSALKQKQKGRNRDIHVSDMDNYIEIKKQIEKNTESLKKANKKSSELKQNSKDIKDKIDRLKISKLNKDNYILSKEDKDSLVNTSDLPTCFFIPFLFLYLIGTPTICKCVLVSS
jgi:septal ring factor EnvC (AmiA/AmiB activator)